MRNVLKSHSEVCHVWAQQNQERGEASRMFFKGDTIYSYGEHFPIARFEKPGVVLFTTDSYSISTSKHISYTRQAINHCTLFHVPNVLAETKDSHKRNLSDYAARITAIVLKSSRARDNKGYYLQQAENLRRKGLSPVTGCRSIPYFWLTENDIPYRTEEQKVYLATRKTISSIWIFGKKTIKLP